MIKLSFSNFKLYSDGKVSEAQLTATIKWFNGNIWQEVAHKLFQTKLTLKHGDSPDLNKVLAYCRAKLEKDAYKWAGEEAAKELKVIRQHNKIFNDFVKKSKYIVTHNEEYLKKF